MSLPPGRAEEVAQVPASEDWRRLHPLSPLLRGGLAFIVIVGIVIANLRDRIIEIVVPDDFIGEAGPNENDVIDFIIAEGLIIIVLLAVLGVLLLILFFAWLSWRFRTFRISDEAVEERSGIIFRQHRRAPLERIQSVNLQRPLLARILGLTQVDVQTAGQGGKVALRYLSHHHAKEVREQILRATAAHREPLPDGRESQAPQSNTFAPLAAGEAAGGAGDLSAQGMPLDSPNAGQHGSPQHGAPQRLGAELDRRAIEFVDADIDEGARRAGSLVQVPIGRLIGSILLGWDLMIPVLMMAASIVAGIVWVPYFFGATIPLVFVVVSIAFSQFNRGWGFTLSRSSDGIRVGAGLTATNTETVPYGRIHAIEARQPLAWRPFGWWKVRITTAGHSVSQGGQNRLQNMVLPVGLEADVLRVFDTVLPSEDPNGDDVAARIDELRGPGTASIGAGRHAGWVLWFGRRRAGLQIDTQADTLRIRRGALTRSLSVMPLVRAQSVQLRRPLVHRMIGLASIQSHTVLGPVRMEMRGLDLETAQGIFDELAATIVRVQAEESDRRGEQLRHPSSPSDPLPDASEGQ